MRADDRAQEGVTFGDIYRWSKHAIPEAGSEESEHIDRSLKLRALGDIIPHSRLERG